LNSLKPFSHAQKNSNQKTRKSTAFTAPPQPRGLRNPQYIESRTGSQVPVQRTNPGMKTLRFIAAVIIATATGVIFYIVLGNFLANILL
jgi:hypothetical protein